MNEVFGLSISEGAIANILARPQAPLVAAADTIAAAVRASPVVGSDEALTVTEGETVDFSAVENWVLAVGKACDLRACAYDPYMPMQMQQRLRNDGYPMIEYRASTLNFSEPTKLLDALMRERKITHDGDPVLAWCLGNVVGHYDARSNVCPRREDPSRKIDCAVATIMALGASISAVAVSDYIYRDRGLLVF